MEVSARTATRDDLDDLEDLATQAAGELAGSRGGPLWRRQWARDARVRQSLADDVDEADALVVVGTIDGATVGYGAVRAVPLVDGGLLGNVSDLYTLEGARGVGVGESMMEAMLDWSRDRGCVGVDSMALPGDRATKNFFESFGLVARAIVVHRGFEA